MLKSVIENVCVFVDAVDENVIRPPEPLMIANGVPPASSGPCG
jgi:hypothetical protein